MANRGGVLMERYELGRLLGQGAFAKVYYARSIRTGETVAIKVIDKEKILRIGLINQIKREISIMRLVKHPNIVQLYEVMATKTKIYFVLEYVKGGELFEKVAKGKLQEDVARKYFQQLIKAIDFCHSRGVYHRDLKPENLLLDEDENLKVSDFGLSALNESKRQDGLLHTTCGTPAYVSPEVINRQGYDGVKADVWSCGVILYVLLAGYLPFYDSNLMEMYRKIGKAEFKCPKWFPAEVRKLLPRMLDRDPSTRITIARIRQNSWFKIGLCSRSTKPDIDGKEMASSSGNTADNPCQSCGMAADEERETVRFSNLNAFDIIALSNGFDLSGLIEGTYKKQEARFTSRQPGTVIISKLKDVAKRLKLKLSKKEGGLFKFEGIKEGRKGILSIDAEIFEVTPAFRLVEMKKTIGDSFEFQRILHKGIKPGLQDIIWAWQGEQLPQQFQQQQQQQQLPEDQQKQLPQEQQQQQLHPEQQKLHEVSISHSQQLLQQEKLP